MRHRIAALALIAALGAGGITYALSHDDSKSCGTRTIARAEASSGRERLQVVNPPPHSVAGGGRQRVDVSGHRAILHGPGTLRVVCH